MTTIEEQRAQVVSKLGELNTIRRPTYTAKDLHQPRAMMARVQRQEQRRYMENIGLQKTKLTKDISNIDAYLKSVSDYETYLASLQQPAPIINGGFLIQSVELPTPVSPIVLPAPVIVFGPKPVLTKTRLSRYQKRGKY